MPLYLKYGKIEGEATQSGFEKWIPIGSVQFGCGRSVSTPLGDAGRRESSTASVSEVTVTKTMDKSSTDIMKEAIFNTKGEDCQIKLSRQKSDGSEDAYLAMTLKNTIISSYSLSSAGERPAESLALNFTEVEMAYTPQDATGNLSTDVKRVTYNIGTGKGG